MNYFSYPLDSKALLRKKTAIKKKLLENGSGWIDKKIAVLGGSTTHEIVEQLELFLLHHGIRPEFYQSEYGLYWEDAVFGNSELDAFHPDIIYVHTNWRNITTFPDLEHTAAEVDSILEGEFSRLKSMWEAIKKRYGCPVIQNNFERPNYRLMGNRDIWDFRGRSNFISCLNQMLYQYAQKESSFFINDIDYISQEYGLLEWGNPLYWNMYKYICCMNAIPYLAQSVANIIKSIYGKNKKVLALDLDNTLWGGVIGEDGVEGLRISPELPSGQVYYEFQSYCKNLQRIGVLLAIDSKNDMENALEGLEHPDVLLKKDDFVSIKANWNPKNENLREIAEELSLGLDSFVFVDDNPAERELVKAQLPIVETPEMDVSENFIKVLDHSGYFEITSFSEEDLKRTEQYQARTNAINVQAQFDDYDAYLGSLRMKVKITEFEPIYVQRIAQLTNKSNQFNLTTLRCSEDDIRAMQENENYICLCGRLIDKFSDHGIVTIVAGRIEDNRLDIGLWLMSCRVLKRGLEHAMMNALIAVTKDRGIKEVVGNYYPTKKNGMVKTFYQEMGFQFVSEDEHGNVKWLMRINDYIFQNTNITIEQ